MAEGRERMTGTDRQSDTAIAAEAAGERAVKAERSGGHREMMLRKCRTANGSARKSVEQMMATRSAMAVAVEMKGKRRRL